MHAVTSVVCLKKPYPRSLHGLQDAAQGRRRKASAGSTSLWCRAPVRRKLCQIPVLCHLEPRLLTEAEGEAKPYCKVPPERASWLDVGLPEARSFCFGWLVFPEGQEGSYFRRRNPYIPTIVVYYDWQKSNLISFPLSIQDFCLPPNSSST